MELNTVQMITVIVGVYVYGLIIHLTQERIHKVRPAEGIASEGVTWMVFTHIPRPIQDASVFIAASVWPLYLILIGIAWAALAITWALVVAVLSIVCLVTGTSLRD